MEVDQQVAGESSRYVNCKLPMAAGNRMSRPADGTKPGWAFRHRDGFATGEPVFRRRLLQMAHIFIPLFITKQPAQAEGRLKGAVDYRGPPVSPAFSSKAAGDV